MTKILHYFEGALQALRSGKRVFLDGMAPIKMVNDKLFVENPDGSDGFSELETLDVEHLLSKDWQIEGEAKEMGLE